MPLRVRQGRRPLRPAFPLYIFHSCTATGDLPTMPADWQHRAAGEGRLAGAPIVFASVHVLSKSGRRGRTRASQHDTSAGRAVRGDAAEDVIARWPRKGAAALERLGARRFTGQRSINGLGLARVGVRSVGSYRRTVPRVATRSVETTLICSHVSEGASTQCQRSSGASPSHEPGAAFVPLPRAHTQSPL